MLYLNDLLAELLRAHAAVGCEDLDPAGPLAGLGGSGDLTLILVPTHVLPRNVRQTLRVRQVLCDREGEQVYYYCWWEMREVWR